MEKTTGYLVPREKYLEAGCHIGTKFKHGGMKQYIYRRRKDRLFVMDISKIDQQIRKAAEKLAEYEPEEIVITAVRIYASAAASKTSLVLGNKVIQKRFVPGTFTNPNIKYFMEPKILFVCDPKSESEAIREAKIMKIPVISLCDTENDLKNIDIAIPCNNKGKRSLALIFNLLVREYMMKKGLISSYSEFKHKPREFEDIETIEIYNKKCKEEKENTIIVEKDEEKEEKQEEDKAIEKVKEITDKSKEKEEHKTKKKTTINKDDKKDDKPVEHTSKDEKPQKPKEEQKNDKPKKEDKPNEDENKKNEIEKDKKEEKKQENKEE